MLIMLDPTEMIAASETLRSCAIETAAIGSQLRGCACCPMPAAFQSVVDELVTVADRALDTVAARLGTAAADLTNRAQIAATDSLAAAASAVGANPSPNTNVSSEPLAVSVVLDGQAYAQVDGVLVPVNPGLVQTLVGGGPGGIGNIDLDRGRTDTLPGDSGWMFGPLPGMVDPFPGLTHIIANLPMEPQRSQMGAVNFPVGGPSDTPGAVLFQTLDRAVAAGLF